MGEHDVKHDLEAGELRLFMKSLLEDLRALEHMIDQGMIETGVRRIGAEQELFLVDPHRAPAPRAMELLADLDPRYFTTELALYNLEFNLDPIPLGHDCLSHMERDLKRHLDEVRRVAHDHDADIALVGILPTLAKSHLSLDFMTPKPRYYALNEAIHRLRGSEFEFRIKGPDELTFKHDNVMAEACNTSFQVHFQVDDREFPHLYNIAQAVAAPVLAAAVNSPMLFGKRLWRETRIALFQQSVDTRPTTEHVREQRPRVSFGRRWVTKSVLEIFQEDIARFRVLLGKEIDEDPFAALERGEIPELTALRLHNGTVYRWNRPCYGISEGKPHLRIENRVLPAGPTPVDEIANAAFWFGLIKGVEDRYGDISRHMEFDHAKENFLAAARLGLQAQFLWPDRPPTPARELILEELLPMARAGLDHLGIDPEDRDRYLGILEERVSLNRTGSHWLLDSMARMAGAGGTAERLAALTSAAIVRQEEGRPVHEWKLADLEEAGGWERHYSRVEQFMTTDLFTVNQHELVDLVACLMDWEHIRHVPVEDNQHRLVGLVSHRSLLRLMAQGKGGTKEKPTPVSAVMHREVITVTPETPTMEAIGLMKRHKVGCLPVVKNEKLVGIVTERDFMNVAAQLLEEVLGS